MVRKCVGLVTMTLAAALCCAAAGCSLGMDDVLGRTTRDPFAELPAAHSFNGDYSVTLHWTRDEAADEYYLFRAVDGLSPRYELIYRGLLNDYKDVFELTFVDKPYLYRLGKRRGDKLFVDFTGPSKTSLGIVSGSIRDLHEPNNTRGSATELSTIKLAGNSWFFSSNTIDGVSVYDEDWYYVDIPAHWGATLVLADLDPIEESAETHFVIEQWGIGSEPVETKSGEKILNTSNKPERFYVRISPNFEIFRLHHADTNSSSGGYGKFVRYTITVSQFTQE